jgi:uncharacterized membrane protein
MLLIKVILKNYKQTLWQIALALFFILMLRITLKYFPISSDKAFLQIKQTEILDIKPYFFIFYVHVCASIFTLLAGFTQFNTSLLKKHPSVHKWFGKFYVFMVLFLASPSGFYIGLFANGGFYSKISFVSLAILWFYFTLKGILFIEKNNISKHKAFMERSFALAFSAITLRLWKVIIINLFHPAPMDVYQIIAWLGWIPNLLFIEYYIFKHKNK